MIDLRTYTTPPDKLEALHDRFRDYTLRLAEKHGMTHLGYWTLDGGEAADRTLVYMLSFPGLGGPREGLQGLPGGPGVDGRL